MEFSHPPVVDVSQPPPMQQAMAPSTMQLTAPPISTSYTSFPPPSHGLGNNHHRAHYFPHHSGAGKPGHPYFKPFGGFNRGHGGFGMTQDDFDGKRLRKSVMRKTVDYNASIVKAIETRLWQRDFRDRHALQPESIYVPELLPPPSYLDNPSNAVTTRFVKTATNKMRCPIFTLAWTPEGRRLVTGASSGEFTLWNGLTFNFETILQAHDVPVRTMVWSHNDSWMVTGDHSGYVKYWQSNMNNVKMFQAHKEPIRGISFSPSDSKFVSCSDDGTLRVWDFLRCHEERVLRGHGADVKCVHWHPHKALIVSGSKDNQQPIKLWDPKSGLALATLHAHKSTVMDLKWNANGNWLVTASRDHLLKLFDVRNLREEIQIFRGHKKEASSVSWHPTHEGLFCSGGSDGSILFWNVGTDKEIGGIEAAHDSIVWTLAWHPLGHILCSGSNDHTIKFWTRNRPGDLMRDKYNLNTLPASLATMDECEYDDAIIPGMGPEDKVEFTESLTADKGFIPGLDLDPNKLNEKEKEKKVPYSKPIPRNFQAQWNDSRRPDEPYDEHYNNTRDTKENILSHNSGDSNSIDTLSGLSDGVDPNAVAGFVAYGRFIRVLPDSQLATVIRHGPDALNKYINSGKIEELRDVVPWPTNEDRSRSQSPVSQVSKNNSPPPKKSRFEPRTHTAQIIYYRDILDQRNSNPNKSLIPSLLGLNLLQPSEDESHQQQSKNAQPDQDFRRFKTELNNQSKPSPWARGFAPSTINNESNRRLSPWASGPLSSNNNNPNGFPTFNMGGGNGNAYRNNNNPFNSPSSFGGAEGHNFDNFKDELNNQLSNSNDGFGCGGVVGCEEPNVFENNEDGNSYSGMRGKGSRFSDNGDGDFTNIGENNRRGGKSRNRDGGRHDNRSRRQNRNRSRRF